MSTSDNKVILLREYFERIIDEREKQNLGRWEYFERIIDEREKQGQELEKQFQRQLIELEKLIEARFEALALAVAKQEAAYNVRFLSLNEWRAAFGDVVTRAVAQNVFEAMKDEHARRISTVESRISNMDGRIVGWSAGFTLLMGAILFAIQVFGLAGG